LPFTPYHFGPGVLAKSLAPRRFSLTAHVAAQVAIDVETLYAIVKHTKPDHGFFHTMVGASLVGLSVAVALAIVAPVAPLPGWRWLKEDLQWPALCAGGLFGGLSHAILDSMYHPDAMPFWPWSGGNPLLVAHHVPPDICVATGVLGLVILAWRALRRALRRA
jgi:membrane-bound metal-dependent hydrolase YbcI (DUF457 family)